MAKMKIWAYEAEIKSEFYEDGTTVLLGVDEEGHPDYAVWECYADEKIYFYLSAEELANLKVGDVLNDGEDFTIMAIDKDNPHIFEIEYDEKESDDESI